MDARFLHYYNRELQHLREMGGEFAKEFPKIAGRLGLEGFECADPYVERLLEGFSFLAARVHVKLDAQFPRFTQHLLELVYPQYLAPTPSMTVVKITPELSEGSLAAGMPIARGTPLRSLLGKGEPTACEFRTSQDVTLWPIELHEATYFPTAGAVGRLGVPDLGSVKAAIRLRLRATAGVNFDQTELGRLELYLRGADEFPMRIYEQLLGNTRAVVVRPAGAADAEQQTVLGRECVQRCGFAPEQALLPDVPRTFEGYRLLQEYFAFPQRFMFVAFEGLRAAVKRCATPELELLVLLERSDTSLDQTLNATNFELFCTPAINLFPRRADRIYIDNKHSEYQIVADKTRPLDFEVHSVLQVTGYGTSGEREREFRPLYTTHSDTRLHDEVAFYTLNRRPRLLSTGERRRGARSGSYAGGEVFLSLVDAHEAPYPSSLRQLGLEVLCTNRDLPLHLPVGRGKSDFTWEVGAPLVSVRCLAGPTRPRPSPAEGDTTWDLINHLSLNYLSLLNSDQSTGAGALRELLALYGDSADAAIRKQIDGLISIEATPIMRRIPLPGPVTVGRGLNIALTLEEAAFEGIGVFLFGAVMEEFFAKYVSINSFTETSIKTLERGEVMKWPVRIGRRHLM